MRSILFLFLLLAPFGFGQNTGLYGKKSVVEFQMLGSAPLLANWADGRSFLKASGDGLQRSQNLLDYGVRVGIMRAFTNQFGLGVEFSFERQGMSAPNQIELPFNSGFGTFVEIADVSHEYIRLNTIGVMPKFEFSLPSNLLPIGMSHQVGIGYARTTIVERDYVYNVFLNSGFTPSTDIYNGLIDYDDVISGFTVMYQINMRKPITERIMINYGIRYTANFVRSPDLGAFPPGEFDMITPIRNKRNWSLIQLNLGMGFAF